MKQYEMRKFVCLGILFAVIAEQGQALAATNAPATVPWSQIGTKAGANYKGDGLAVTQTASGARLHCVFQRLDGEATPQGLWLTSTVTNTLNERFCVTAMEIGRKPATAVFDSQGPEFNLQLPAEGNVALEGQTACFARPGLTEEYSVSMNGVRQDFIVEQAPPFARAGELLVKLAVTGARVEPAVYGARLVLENSGRKIAYSRLRATDATGRDLPARIEVIQAGDPSETGNLFEGTTYVTPTIPGVKLAVVVNDADAVYPLRIDPTFSDANWVSMGGSGTSGIVFAAVVDGSGNLDIGGSFAFVGNTEANNIAQWNGNNWFALGSGLSGEVQALAVSGGTLYAGGDFTMAGVGAANYIAEWNGSSWSPLGSGMNNDVDSLAVSGSTLYAGGDFTMAGGSTAKYTAQWTGNSWSALGSGMNSSVSALAVSGSTVYAGGHFTNAGGGRANYIAQWNGSSWSALGSGMNSSVSALAVSGSTLYAGGYFTNAGGGRANYIAQWNGSSWSALGSGMNGYVNALAVSGTNLYAGGGFDTAGGSTAYGLAKWNGSNWSDPPWLESGNVFALAATGNILYIGGEYNGGIAEWNGSSISTLGPGISGEGDNGIGPGGIGSVVFALAVSGNTVYAGGAFNMAGGNAVNSIAQWNGSGWAALGSGVSGLGQDGNGPYVSALKVSGSTLYVGGDFSAAGGSAANNIAQWNGSSWSPLGAGISGMGDDGFGPYVSALEASGGTLYVGGDFSAAGGGAANNIAQWNGSSWAPLGTGLSGVDQDGNGNGPYVSALAAAGSTLYAGGSFSTAGGVAANDIAQWNGNSWSVLGSGIGGGSFHGVAALAVSGSTLYAGGAFTMAGGVAVNNIAQWNGSSWSALGLGISMPDVNGFGLNVSALAVSGGMLYVGGAFSAAGSETNANEIAQWDGSSWSELGSGMNDLVFALAASGSTLYVGGIFTMAGTNFSSDVAEALLSGPPAYLAIITTNSMFGFTNGAFGFDVSGPSGSNVVIQASTNLQTWIPLQTNLLGSGLLYFSDSQSHTNRARFYRVQLLP
ncbi:MAG: beta strand repeat-containing protein [Limisphaerales bacterium]